MGGYLTDTRPLFLFRVAVRASPLDPRRILQGPFSSGSFLSATAIETPEYRVGAILLQYTVEKVDESI